MTNVRTDPARKLPGHRGMIESHLHSQLLNGPRGKDIEYLRRHNELAHEVAEQVAIAINRKTGKEYSDIEMPSNWKLDDSRTLATVAYKVGKFVRDRVPGGDYQRSIKSYLNTALGLNYPEFNGEKPFTEEVFDARVQRYNPMTGKLDIVPDEVSGRWLLYQIEQQMGGGRGPTR